jgi:glycosyltransferase involved in cell wall biosynthesis
VAAPGSVPIWMPNRLCSTVRAAVTAASGRHVCQFPDSQDTDQPAACMTEPKIAVVIPCYRVKEHVMDVLANIGAECSFIFVVDDCCPDASGQMVKEQSRDQRVVVIRHDANRGVGGAVMSGYRAALGAGADIVVKVDGDGQMDPRLIPRLVSPLIRGEADYAKGNRFYALYGLHAMPRVRLIGNAVLSFMTKLSSGYWKVFDPTNGFTAVHATALRQIEMKNIDERYFFETDMLIHLGVVRAVVRDIPMEAHYGTEKSNLKIRSIIGQFLGKHLYALCKRVIYLYFLRDFGLGSINLIFGVLLFAFGTIFGGIEWLHSAQAGVPATAGTVMIAVLPMILGFQLLLSFVSFDVANEPTVPLQQVSGRRN